MISELGYQNWGFIFMKEKQICACKQEAIAMN